MARMTTTSATYEAPGNVGPEFDGTPAPYARSWSAAAADLDAERRSSESASSADYPRTGSPKIWHNVLRRLYDGQLGLHAEPCDPHEQHGQRVVDRGRPMASRLCSSRSRYARWGARTNAKNVAKPPVATPDSQQGSVTQPRSRGPPSNARPTAPMGLGPFGIRRISACSNRKPGVGLRRMVTASNHRECRSRRANCGCGNFAGQAAPAAAPRRQPAEALRRRRKARCSVSCRCRRRG